MKALTILNTVMLAVILAILWDREPAQPATFPFTQERDERAADYSSDAAYEPDLTLPSYTPDDTYVPGFDGEYRYDYDSWYEYEPSADPPPAVFFFIVPRDGQEEPETPAEPPKPDSA